MIQLPAMVAVLLDDAADRYGVPRALARAVAWVESRGHHTKEGSNPPELVQSSAGALGVMQLMPRTAEGLGVDATDLAANVDGGVKLLGRLLERFGGDEARAVAAYNWGSGNLLAHPHAAEWPDSVQRYVTNVLRRAELERTGTELDLPRAGVRSFRFDRGSHMHNGIDLRASKGTPIYAAATGTVEHATHEWQQGFTGYGRVVVVADTDGNRQLYGHLEQALVRPGQVISAGDLLAYSGDTEFSKSDHASLTEPHLHFEVAPGKYPMARGAPRLDPIAWLEQGRIHPVARVAVGSAPTPFELRGSRPSQRSRSELQPSELRSQLLERWGDLGEALAELELRAPAALRGRMAELRNKLAPHVLELAQALGQEPHA